MFFNDSPLPFKTHLPADNKKPSLNPEYENGHEFFMNP